jgi:hypothetical protein
VPFLSFPTTSAFLYADQANLTPGLSVPNNTLALMYDECGRTTQLGPNEYVLVSFKTVEVENGQEKLKNYNLHLFTDGTIIFIEDGVLQPPGRAQLIEGMRGAVGFGRSPNCSFNHVIAEFQIELSAAGGHSYSSDPLSWSSTVPPQPAQPPPPPPGPNILNVSIAGSLPIHMGDFYNLLVTVADGTPNVSVTVTTNEQAVTPPPAPPSTPPPTLALGDSVFSPGPLLTGVQPSNPSGSSFLFPASPFSFSHYWHWMGNLDHDCVTDLQIAMGTIVGPAADQIIEDQFKIIAAAFAKGGVLAVDVGVALYDILSDIRKLVPQGFYQYPIQASDQAGGSASQLFGPVQVTIPDYKGRSAITYFTATFPVFMLTALSTPLSLALEATAIFFSCAALDTARDPDPNFTQIVVRQPIVSPTVESLPDSSGKRLAEAWLSATADMKAMGTSLGRFEGAKAANNKQWVIAQLQAAQGFDQTLNADLLVVKSLTAAFVQDLQAQGIQVSPASLATAQSQILATGLPQLEQNILGELGFSPQTIASLGPATAALIGFLPTDWQNTLTSGTDGIIASVSKIGDWIDREVLIVGGQWTFQKPYIADVTQSPE